MCHSLLARGNCAPATLNHQKRHVDWLYTPQDENGRMALSSRLLEGMPLAWGAKVHAGTCRRDPFFSQAAEGQGHLRVLTGTPAFFFRGK